MDYFFILGCPRSGTTVLQQAMNRHSKVIVPPETKYFQLFYRQPRSLQNRHLKRLEADLQIELPALNSERQSVDWARSYFDEMARRYVAACDRRDVSIFGEKTPEHTSQIPHVREVFPQAKLIFMYRDGRDVALSLSKVPWMRCSVYGGFLIWMYYWRILRDVMANGMKDVCLVKYEEFVTQPVQELRRITDFLGLDFQEDMAAGHGNTLGIPEREFAWKGTALEPITTTRIEQWRHDLSDVQIQDLEWIGREALPYLNYEFVSPSRAPGSRFLRTRLAMEAFRCVCQLPWPILRKEWVRLLTSPFSFINFTGSGNHQPQPLYPAKTLERR